MQDPNNPNNNYGRSDNNRNAPSNQPPSYVPPPTGEYQGNYQPPSYPPPPPSGYQPPSEYQGNYPPANYPPPGYQQPTGYQGNYPPPGYPQPPAGYQPYPPYQAGGPYAPPPSQMLMPARRSSKSALLSVLGVALLIALGAAAYFLFLSPSSQDARLFKQALQNMKDAKSYHVDLNGTVSGEDLKMSGDFDVADNKSKLHIELSGTGYDAVLIGSDVYVSTDAGKHFINAGSNSGQITSSFSQFTRMWNTINPSSLSDSGSGLNDAGSDIIDGSDCKHITIATKGLSTSGGVAGTVTLGSDLDLWAAKDGSHLCQMKVKGNTSSFNADMTVRWSKLNQSFDITVPNK